MKHLLELIKKYEGCHKRQADGTLIAYKCPAGVWTIGWGTTGRYVREGTVWTQEKADERLVKDAQTAIDAALKELEAQAPVSSTRPGSASAPLVKQP